MSEIVDRIEVEQDMNARDSPYYGSHWKRVTLNLHADGSVTWTTGEPNKVNPYREPSHG